MYALVIGCSGFDNDLRVKANVEIVVSETEAPHHRLTLDGLRNTFETAKANGKVVKALLITNPHNPLGTCIQREELEAVCVTHVVIVVCCGARELSLRAMSASLFRQSTLPTKLGFTSFPTRFTQSLCTWRMPILSVWLRFVKNAEPSVRTISMFVSIQNNNSELLHGFILIVVGRVHPSCANGFALRLCMDSPKTSLPLAFALGSCTPKIR